MQNKRAGKQAFRLEWFGVRLVFDCAHGAGALASAAAYAGVLIDLISICALRDSTDGASICASAARYAYVFIDGHGMFPPVGIRFILSQLIWIVKADKTRIFLPYDE